MIYDHQKSVKQLIKLELPYMYLHACIYIHEKITNFKVMVLVIC